LGKLQQQLISQNEIFAREREVSALERQFSLDEKANDIKVLESKIMEYNQKQDFSKDIMNENMRLREIIRNEALHKEKDLHTHKNELRLMRETMNRNEIRLLQHYRANLNEIEEKTQKSINSLLDEETKKIKNRNFELHDLLKDQVLFAYYH
jgi:hypothetical protein